jgi:small subunit ribosomal protein S6
MRRYELMVIFPMEEDQHKAGRDQILNDLAANGAEIEKTDEIGERNLAYDIKKRKKGRYVLLVIKADPARITVLDRVFKLNANLLKYLFVRVDEQEKADG